MVDILESKRNKRRRESVRRGTDIKDLVVASAASRGGQQRQLAVSRYVAKDENTMGD